MRVLLPVVVKKEKKARLLVPFIIILLANWLANKGGALQTKAFAPSILHTAIKLCPKHILEFCPFRYTVGPQNSEHFGTGRCSL